MKSNPPPYLDETGALILHTLVRHQVTDVAPSDMFGLYLIAYLCQRRYGDRDDESLIRLLREYGVGVREARDA